MGHTGAVLVHPLGMLGLHVLVHLLELCHALGMLRTPGFQEVFEPAHARGVLGVKTQEGIFEPVIAFGHVRSNLDQFGVAVIKPHDTLRMRGRGVLMQALGPL